MPCLCSKGNTGQPVLELVQEIWIPARGIFCVEMWGFLLVLGSRHEVDWDFLLVQQQKLYPLPTGELSPLSL